MNYNDRATIYHGPAKISAEIPFSTIPLFVREGAIIPRGDILKVNNNWDWNRAPKLRIEFLPSAGTASRIDYYTGNAVLKFTAEAKGNRIASNFGIHQVEEIS